MAIFLSLLPWISPRPRRWHLVLWAEGVEGVCQQEGQDPASQYLEENRDMRTLNNKVVCSVHVKSPVTPLCLLVG